ATKELEAVLATGKAPAKWHAIWGLDAIGAGEQAIIGGLKDEDPSVRRQAARQLGTRKQAPGEIFPLLRDPDATVRFQAATALGRIGNPMSIVGLRDLLEEKDLYVRYAAFKALNRLGRARPLLWGKIVEGLQSDKPAIREGTLFALRETYDEELAKALAAAPMSPESIAVLAEMHRMPPAWKGDWWGTQPVARPRPALVVGYGGTKIVLETLRAALGDANAAVRRAAVESVAVTKDVEAAKALRELFAKESDADVRKSILKSLGAIKDAAAAELVASAFKDPALLVEAATAAEQIGGPILIQMLADLAENATAPEILVPALGALGRLKAGVATAAKH